jgi:hypothetical protein
MKTDMITADAAVRLIPIPSDIGAQCVQALREEKIHLPPSWIKETLVLIRLL